MPRPRFFAFALVFLLPLSLSAGTLKEDVLGNSIRLIANDCQGTGTAIKVGDRVLVLTAAHVVEGSMAPRMVRYVDALGVVVDVPDNTPLPLRAEWKKGGVSQASVARVVWYPRDYDNTGDMALLTLDDAGGLVGAEMGVEVEEGEDVWYCGTGGGIPQNLVKSIINQQDDRWILVNGEGWYGHSGSGIFVKRGDKFVVVGVLSRFTVRTDTGWRGPLASERRITEFVRGYTEQAARVKAAAAEKEARERMWWDMLDAFRRRGN